MFRIQVFGTGSSGNSALVSDGETNILIDAGVRTEKVQEAIMICDIDAVLLTHEHGDHSDYVASYLSVYSRHIYATNGTWDEIKTFSTALSNIIEYGKPFTVGTLTIIPFPLSHDAAEPCGFFIKNELGETIVWVSDTGTMDGLAISDPATCYVIEANYDEDTIDEKLENGELPYEGLHGRLTSEFGHLSIQQAAAWLKENAWLIEIEMNDSHVIVLSPHAEIVEKGLDLLAYFKNVTIPLSFPFTYEFGKKCPF